MKGAWWDVPITVDERKPVKVEILWDEVPGIEVVTPLLAEMNDRMEATLAAGPATGVEAYAGTTDEFEAVTQDIVYSTPPGSKLRLQQPLAEAGYLPLEWKPSGAQVPRTEQPQVRPGVSAPKASFIQTVC